MKIDAGGPVRSAAASRRAGRSSGARSGAFGRLLDTSETPSGVSGAQPLGPVGAMLSIQEMGDALTGPARARQRAADILDRLDDIRDGLLAGQVSRARMVELAALVRARRGDVDDEELRAILDEIELRAEVELAKLQQEERS